MQLTATDMSPASGASSRAVAAAASPRSTRVSSRGAPASRRERSSSFSDVRCSRSASEAMSETNSRTVAASMPSLWVMLSASNLMAASGVFSSCEASETNLRRSASVVCSRSVRSLNSSESSVSSSLPSGFIRCS